MKIKEIHKLISAGTYRKEVNVGDVFLLNIDGIGHIPGIVARNKCNIVFEKQFEIIIYIYNQILEHKHDPIVFDKNNLLFPPKIVLKNNWAKDFGFEYLYTLASGDVDTFSDHCFYSRTRGSYFNEHGNITEKFEPCGTKLLTNITVISCDILKKIKNIEVCM